MAHFISHLIMKVEKFRLLHNHHTLVQSTIAAIVLNRMISNWPSRRDL